MKASKRDNLDRALEEVIELEDAGHTVVRFTDFHWRINDVDVWPTSQKFQKNGVIKHYDHLHQII